MVFITKQMKNRGLAQIPLMIILLLMAIAVPVATKLVQRSADTRNLATHNACVAGVLNTFGCGKTGLVSVSGCPTQVYFNCLPGQFSKVTRSASCACSAVCVNDTACATEQCLATDMGTCTCPGGATGVNHRNGDCTFTCKNCPAVPPTLTPTPTGGSTGGSCVTPGGWPGTCMAANLCPLGQTGIAWSNIGCMTGKIYSHHLFLIPFTKIFYRYYHRQPHRHCHQNFPPPHPHLKLHTGIITWLPLDYQSLLNNS